MARSIGYDAGMLQPDPHRIADLPPDRPPLLLVVVDTEAEFDWSQAYSREATSVGHMRQVVDAERVFAAHGIVPLYVVDYAIATQPDGYRPLQELADEGRCRIGAHLHPWINPPFTETVNVRNSYPGNLEPDLERAKLTELTQAIGAAFGNPPTVYKAGRYGVGAATPALLGDLGYRIDTSVVPGTDFSHDGGPDFRHCPTRPFWFGPGNALLEIPTTVGFAGPAAALHQPLHRDGQRQAVASILARLHLMERVRLTPEGMTADACIRLTRTLIRRGQRIFCYSFHSPSLEPGHTPYVTNPSERAWLLDRMDRFFGYFMGELGGQAATPEAIRQALEAQDHGR